MSGYQSYLENEVMGADPVKLVTLLYQGAIEATVGARDSLRSGDIAGRSKMISKATLILNELALNLDHAKGGEFSRMLAELYDYMIRRLNEANFEQTEAPLKEVEGLLGTVLDAWKECSATARTGVYAEEYVPLSLSA